MTDLLIVTGLTGVGKSTVVAALADGRTLLPNRRALTDAFIIPEVQRLDGRPPRPVTDRLERFELTRRYRELYPGGMVYALKQYLQLQNVEKGSFVFDNLRGLGETQAAVSAFPDARFVLLDAPPLVRLSRLVGRRDPFDDVAAEPKRTSLTKQLVAMNGLSDVFDLQVLASWAAQGVSESDLLRAARIIIAEAQNYDMAAAADFLHTKKRARDFLHLETADLPAEVVQERVRAWLE